MLIFSQNKVGYKEHISHYMKVNGNPDYIGCPVKVTSAISLASSISSSPAASRISSAICRARVVFSRIIVTHSGTEKTVTVTDCHSNRQPSYRPPCSLLTVMVAGTKQKCHCKQVSLY